MANIFEEAALARKERIEESARQERLEAEQRRRADPIFALRNRLDQLERQNAELEQRITELEQNKRRFW